MRITLAIAATLVAGAAHATPEYIKTADFNEGKFELQYQLITSTDNKPKKDNKTKHQFDAFYVPVDGVLLLGGGKASRDSSESFDIDSFFAGGAYQFIHEEKHGFNAALLGKYIYAIDSDDADVLEGRLLLDKKWGESKKIKTKANLNLLREIGSSRDQGFTFQSRIGAVYKVKEYFQPGGEWQAEFSKNNDAEHQIGPVIYGSLPKIKGFGQLGYEIGWLPGVTDADVNNTFRFLLEYKYLF